MYKADYLSPGDETELEPQARVTVGGCDLPVCTGLDWTARVSVHCRLTDC